MHEPTLTDPAGHPQQYNHRIRFQRSVWQPDPMIQAHAKYY